MISQRYERGATLITSNLPFDEWTETFGTERLTGALLDRLTHRKRRPRPIDFRIAVGGAVNSWRI
jgi:DNA replication protein DnaC